MDRAASTQQGEQAANAPLNNNAPLPMQYNATLPQLADRTYTALPKIRFEHTPAVPAEPVHAAVPGHDLDDEI